LNQPEKSNVDEHKPLLIVPIEFSNRRIEGGVIFWKSPMIIRTEALKNKEKKELLPMKNK